MKKLLLFTAFLLAVQLSLAQWEDDVRLTDDPFTSSNYSWQGITSSGDTVHVVWYDDRDGNYEIYYKRSFDGGQTWGEDIRLTDTPFNSMFVSIATFGLIVHIAWNDDSDGNWEVYYKRSLDGGDNWEDEIRITDTPGITQGSSISVSGSMVYIVYFDFYDNWEVYLKRSTDEGLTWEPGVQLTDNQAISRNPSVCAIDSVVHVVWDDNRDGNREIYYTRSDDEGETWDQETRLTIAESVSRTPDIAAYESDVYIVWMDERDWIGYNFTEIYLKHSSDAGLTWGEDTRLTNYAGKSEFPSLAVCGDRIFIAWQDDRIGIQEIFYKYSADGGYSWHPDTRLTYDPADSFYPCISVSGTQVNVAWSDFRDGNYEIYYKRDPTGNLPVGIEDEPVMRSNGQISVFPNPASRQLTVDSRQFASPSSQSAVDDRRPAVKLSIVDLYGREIKAFKIISTFPYMADISDLMDGVYILRVINEEGKSGSVKFLKIDE